MSYSFTIALQDLASSKIMGITESLGRMQGKLDTSRERIRVHTDKSTRSLDSLQAQLQKLNAARAASTSINDIRELRTQIKHTEREIKKFENLPPKSFGERIKSISAQFGGLVGLVGGVALAMTAWNGIKAVYTKGIELEQMNTKFEVLLGSVSDAQKLLRELNEYANFTPFSNEAIIKSSETMLAFGIEQEKIMSNMRMLGDVAMGNEEKLGSMSLAYSQIMSTGRLMGQDLLQLINQGFNPLQVISENTGISMGDLKKKMEQGAISAEMVEEAFRLATSEGGKFHNMSEKMGETAGGKVSTLLGKLSFVAMQVGERLAQWVNPLIDIGIVAVDNIIPFIRSIRDVFTWVSKCTPLLILLGGVMVGLGVNFLIANASAIAYSISLGVLNSAIWLVTAATTAWNFILSLNPISWIIIAIVALVATVVLLWQKFDWFRGGIMGVWEVLKGFGTMIKNYVINRFQELLSGITGIGKALVSFFKGDWKAAWEIGKKAGEDLLGVNSKQQAIQDGIDAFKGFSTGYEKGVKMYQPEVVQKTKEVNEKVLPKTKQEKSGLFDALDKDDKKNKTKKGRDTIVSGGTRHTNINITIQKLQDDTKIYVSSKEEGISQMGDKISEMLLRAVNSVNQMQTS